MKSIKIDPNKTDWTRIDGNTEIIVAHFDDGHKERMIVPDFLMSARKRKHIVQIDLYTEGEEVKEDCVC